MLFAAGYPPSPTLSSGAPCFSRDQGHSKWDRKRQPGPLPHCERLMADTGEDTAVSPHAWTLCLQRQQDDSQGTGSVKPAEPGSCTNTGCTLTATSEAWAGAQGWLPTSHPSMHKQPLLLGRCAHLACPRSPELPTGRHPAPLRFSLFVRAWLRPTGLRSP